MLTDLACRQAPKKERPYKLSDGRGLFLYVTTTGYKSWRWKYRIGGKEKLVVFGPYPDIGLTEARNLRDTTARDLRAGVDPAIEKRQKAAAQTVRMGNTFELFALEWHASQVPTWSKRHAALVLSTMKADVFPKIGKMPIDAITTPLVLQVLRPIEQRGAIETAHRVRQRISEVFARAIGAGVVTTDPAAVTVKALGRVRKKKNPAVRTIAEAKDVLRRVEAQPGHPLTKLGSRFLALTVVRSGPLRYAEPAEFEDLDGPFPTWRIPATKMKLGVERKEDIAFEFLVPLSRQAVEIVKVAMTFGSNAPLIFHSPRHPRRAMSDSTISKAYRMAGFAGNRFAKSEHNARMRVAEKYEHDTREPGRRNGALGHIGLEILRFMLRLRNGKTGRLDPSLTWLSWQLRRSRSAVAKAMARLEEHGFMKWIRRTRPIAQPARDGQYVEQISNAYYFTMPKAAAELARRIWRRPSDAQRAAERESRFDTVNAKQSLDDVLAGITSPAMRAALTSARAAVDSANPPKGLNETL